MHKMIGTDQALFLGGDDPDAGEVLQAAVKAGRWFASRVQGCKGFGLVGCTVAPGFDFAGQGE